MTLGPCNARIVGICSGMAAHRHHRKLRRHGDERPVNLLEVCPACHTHIHAEPAWSISWGLIVPSWDDPLNVHPESYAHPDSPGPQGPTGR